MRGYFDKSASTHDDASYLLPALIPGARSVMLRHINVPSLDIVVLVHLRWIFLR